MIVWALLFLGANAAPQDTEITYVKMLPIAQADDTIKNTRESRIENIPLTIPGNLSHLTKSENESTLTKPGSTPLIKPGSTPLTNSEKGGTLLTTENEDALKSNSGKRATLSINPENRSTLSNPDNINRPVREAIDNTEQKSSNNDSEVVRLIRSDVTTQNYESETTEPPDFVTETEPQTLEYEARTKAPRFLSKLSYFQKPDNLGSSIATNLVERSGQRRFKSKCRCEKIWNCPKLQITVPRCPNEYFMCCF